MSGRTTQSQPRECRACTHFRNDPATIASEIQGLASFGSAHASVRGDDGLCQRHDKYLGPGWVCADFQNKP
jgi:hypothetical protein